MRIVFIALLFIGCAQKHLATNIIDLAKKDGIKKIVGFKK